MVPVVFAESYPIGIPYALLGFAFIIWFRRIADFFATIQREVAGGLEKALPRKGRDVVSVWLRVGTKDDTPSKAYRYGIVLAVGAMFFLAGTAAVAGLWNPYE
jgi:hypothetical protein